MAYERRMSVLRPHLENQVTEEQWLQQRQQVDNATSGHGIGLTGRNETPYERAAILGGRPGLAFGTAQAIQATGHPGAGRNTNEANPNQQGACQRVFWSQIEKDADQGEKISPLVAWGRASGEGWS